MNYTLERLSHAGYVVVGKAASKLLPDRIPVTFVGAEAVPELGRSIGHLGLDRVLVVSDPALVELGLVGTVTDALTDAGVGHSVYAAVTPDPTFTQVEDGLARYRADACQGIVAVGGGSPMDAAKMIAAMATNDRSLAQLEGKFKVRRDPAPLFAVPTTAGTGSEVTVAAVVSDPDTHQKHFFLDPKLLPSMVALDPGLTTGLPPAMTAATGMDALTHAVESFIARTSNPRTEAFAGPAVRLIFEHLPRAYADGDDLEARHGMALASYYAGLAFTRTSVGYVHALAHNLGAAYGTPHGLANAVALPLVLEISRAEAEEPLARLADLIGLDGGTDRVRSERFVEAVRDLEATVGIPATLDDLRPDDIPELAERARAEAYLEYPVPRYLSQEECERLLWRMLPDV